jgi:hypothetical protein
MRQADIEIYVHCRDLAAIVKWMDTVFSAIEIEQSSEKRIAGSIQLDANTDACDFLLLGKAAAGYSSVWFKQNLTPWDTDIDCGRAAFEALQREVRVSAGGWTEGDEDDLFVRINGDGESRFLWRTS